VRGCGVLVFQLCASFHGLRGAGCSVTTVVVDEQPNQDFWSGELHMGPDVWVNFVFNPNQGM